MSRDEQVAAQDRRWWQFWRRSERIDPLTANEREKQRAWLGADRG